MNRFLVVLLSSALFVGSASAQIQSAQKLIVAVADDWNTGKGSLILYDRTTTGWKKHRLSFSVSFGEKGLGWGEGIHPSQSEGPVKREGDKRSPAGVFELDTVLYGLEAEVPGGVGFPYRPLTDLTRCVDDTGSVSYNRIVEEGSEKKDWTSAENMKSVVPDYRYVLVLKHNPRNEAGKGSCIFLHTNNIPTSGCTSMDESDMLFLLRWLDPNKRTFVVQLPHSEYHRLRPEWNLPPLRNN